MSTSPINSPGPKRPIPNSGPSLDQGSFMILVAFRYSSNSSELSPSATMVSGSLVMPSTLICFIWFNMVSWDVIKNGVEWFLLMFVVVLKMSRMLLQLGVVIFVRIETLVEVVFPLHLFQCRQSPKTSALLGATGPAPHRPHDPWEKNGGFTKRLDRSRPLCPATLLSLWETPRPGEDQADLDGTGPTLSTLGVPLDPLRDQHFLVSQQETSVAIKQWLCTKR